MTIKDGIKLGVGVAIGKTIFHAAGYITMKPAIKLGKKWFLWIKDNCPELYNAYTGFYPEVVDFYEKT